MELTVKIDFDMSPLIKLEEDVQLLNKKVHVGILNDSPNKDTTNAVIAAANEREYGWVTGIGTFVPPRSTIRLPITMKENEIRDASVSKLTTLDEAHINEALDTMGATALKAIQEAFSTGGYGQWERNAPSTIEKKGRDEPMVDEGILREAYSYEVQK